MRVFYFMSTKTYSEKLRDPRWQKCRLEILKRDSWSCLRCGDSENELHVHHLNYQFGRDPWDYPSDNLQTLCGKCHKEETDARVFLKLYIDKMYSNGTSAYSIVKTLYDKYGNIFDKNASS